MDKARFWLRIVTSPVRFWFAVGALLVVVYGMSYAYGAWYASLIVQDAVPVREIRSSARWIGQLEYRDLGNGVRERDFHPAPDDVRFRLTRDMFEEADIAGGGYTTFGRVRAELSKEEEEDEEETQDISYEEWTANLKRPGILLSSEPNVASRTLGVAVGEYTSASDARAKVSEFLATGRHAEVEEVTGPDGQTRYRVVHGAGASQEALSALQHELVSAGLRRPPRAERAQGAAGARAPISRADAETGEWVIACGASVRERAGGG